MKLRFYAHVFLPNESVENITFYKPGHLMFAIVITECTSLYSRRYTNSYNIAFWSLL